MVREIISIGIGQCGVQLGHELWTEYNSEHRVSATGTLGSWTKDGPTKRRHDHIHTLYEEAVSGTFVPRNVFIDSQPARIDSIRNSDCKWMYPDAYLLSGKEDAASNFACGYCTIGKQMMESFNDAIRKKVDECDNFQGFIVARSVGGGTGSGLGSRILEGFGVDYRKKQKLGLEVYPFASAAMSSSVVEPYNALLATHWMLDHTELSVVLDNEKIYELCQRELDIRRPSWRNLNRLITKPAAAITSALRLDTETQLNVDLKEMHENLAPFPRLHAAFLSFAPFAVPNSKAPLRTPDESYRNVQRIMEQSFSERNFLVKCTDFDAEEDKYMGAALTFRGDTKSKELNAAIQWMKTNKKCMWMEWGWPRYLMDIDRRAPIVTDDQMPASARTVAMLANNTLMSRYFSERISKPFNSMYSRRAFVHCYMAEGMEEGEFAEAKEDMDFLEKDYLDVLCEQATDEADDDDDDD